MQKNKKDLSHIYNSYDIRRKGKEDIMKILLILFVIILSTASFVMADITVMDKLDLGKGEEQIKAGVQTLCIDGHKYVVTYGWAAMGTGKGVGAGGGVSMIQVYEEKNGKVVPAKCNS